MDDCTVCGYPTLRQGAHADWCERVRRWLRWFNPENGPCHSDGCERWSVARGLCSTHYKHWYKNGGAEEIAARRRAA